VELVDIGFRTAHENLGQAKNEGNAEGWALFIAEAQTGSITEGGGWGGGGKDGSQ